jgi:hypothetical protein
MENVFEEAHVFIERPKEGFNLSGDMYSAFHPMRRFASDGKWVTDGTPPGKRMT